MQQETVDGLYGRPTTLDLCFPCGALWFDGHESLGLAPGAVLQLFTWIHARRSERRGGTLADPDCPHCHARLVRTQDRQRNVQFTYWSCPARHGRLTIFVEFLREKHFVRPLVAAEIEALRQNVRVVHCDGCGAPVELERTSECGFCGAAVSVLDAQQLEKIVGELRTAETKRHTVDPALPARLLMDRLEVERYYCQLDPEQAEHTVRPHGAGLVAQGLAVIADLLATRRTSG